MSKSSLLQCFLAFWLLGVLVHQLVFRDVWPEIQGGDLELAGEVVELVDREANRQRVRVRSGEVPGLIQLEIGVYPALAVGDTVRAYCELTPIRDLYVEYFRYDRYLAKERVYGVCRGYGSPEVIGVQHSWRRALDRSRSALASQIQRNLHEPHASLLIGLIYGARSTLPDDLTEAFRRTGTMHIVAVSGFNVMVLGNTMLILLTYTVLKRQYAFYVVIVGIVVFVLFAGADAAVVRAGIMGGMALLAKQVGRLRTTMTLFLLAAVIMTAINPRVLMDDVGFQLSFTAAIGLVTIVPRLQRLFIFVPRVAGLRSVLAETVAATLATIPISLWHFKTVSLISPIANLFAVPWITLAMALGMAGMIGSTLIGSAAFLPAYAVLDIMILLVRAFAPLPVIDLQI